LGEMAGNIAHEINNPLAIIGISTQKLKMICLREGKSTEEIDKTLETINQTVHRMSKIVSGMLRVSRESSEESCEDLDLNVLVDETISICMEKIKKNSIDLIWQKSESPVMITGAPIQISQVLLNLISNSIDALESLGEKWIRIELQPSVSDGFVSLIVTDSGDGIAEDLQEKIMKPFYTSKPVGKGTGLGLTISRTLIEVMGGRLIYNPQSKNTQFRVDLPTVKK
ncbi:MAG: sensor histidine kinase, partial [Bdellovibrionales bacterium]